MASSSQIWSEIQTLKAKRMNYNKLYDALNPLIVNVENTSSSFDSALSCLYNGYVTDDGKTIGEVQIGDIKSKISLNLTGLRTVMKMVTTEIERLNSSIDSLQVQFNAAKERERAAEQASQLKKTVKNGSSKNTSIRATSILDRNRTLM